MPGSSNWKSEARRKMPGPNNQFPILGKIERRKSRLDSPHLSFAKWPFHSIDKLLNLVMFVLRVPRARTGKRCRITQSWNESKKIEQSWDRAENDGPGKSSSPPFNEHRSRNGTLSSPRKEIGENARPSRQFSILDMLLFHSFADLTLTIQGVCTKLKLVSTPNQGFIFSCGTHLFHCWPTWPCQGSWSAMLPSRPDGQEIHRWADSHSRTRTDHHRAGTSVALVTGSWMTGQSRLTLTRSALH